jgi:PKD repeat protein
MRKTGLIVLILFSLLSIDNANAWCMVGANITWTCVGQDSFLVKEEVYMDCNGISLSTSQITFKCAATGTTITTLGVSPGTPIDVTPVCNTSCTRCSSMSCSFPYGFRRYTYQGIVNLNNAGSCCNIAISWEWCCRNYSITTGPGDQNFYIDAELNRCQNPCDNSPSFTNTPVMLVCSGQDFTFNHGALDTDVKSTGELADSLTYEWTEPLELANLAVTYTGQYAYDKPITFSGFPNASLALPQGFHLDPHTGDIQFRPTKAEITVMVLQVNEFRNGVKIGKIKRDLQMMVIACTSNNPPTISTPGNVRSISVFPGDTAIFNFTTSDANTNDSVSINWNNAIAGATWTSFNNGPSKNSSATLTWLPTFAQAGSLPYNFTVTAKDNVCPVKAQFTQSYQVNVSPVPIIKIDPIAKRCINGSIIKLNDFVTVNGKHTTKGTWSSPGAGLISGDSFNPAVAGVSTAPGWKVKYEYTDSASGRYNKDSAYITVYALPKPNAGKDDTVCTGAKISLLGLPASSKAGWRGTGIEGSYPNWKFNPDASGIINGGRYELIYHYIDANTCENEDTASFTVFRTLPSDAGTDMDFCIDGIAQPLTGLPAGGSWTGSGVAGNVFYPYLAKVGVHDLNYSYTNVICTTNDTAKYTVWDLPVVTAATQSADTIFCRTVGLIPLNGQPTGTGGVWSGPGVNGNNFNTAIGADVTTDYSLRYEYTDTHKCRNNADMIVRVVPEPDVVVDQSDGDHCSGNPLSIKALYNHATGVTWWKGTQSDGTIIGNPDSTTIIYKPGINDMLKLNFWLFIRTTHAPDHVCSPAYDSIQILKSAMPVANFAANQTSGGLPLNVQFSDSTTISRGTIQSWEWHFGDGNMSADQNPAHTYHSSGTFTVKLIIISDAGCVDSMVKTNYIHTTTGMNFKNGSDKFEFYPNPAHNIMIAEYSGTGTARLVMKDIIGNSIMGKMIKPGKNELKLTNYKPGIYFIFLDGLITGKLLIE